LDHGRPKLASYRSIISNISYRVPIFCEVQKIENVGIYDDFFALGGHSLLVTQVVGRINSAFQIDLSIRALFDAPTVNSLVAAIVESQAGQFDDDSLSQMLADLEWLAEDEVDASFNNNGARAGGINR
jgi:acyl carrier protein